MGQRTTLYLAALVVTLALPLAACKGRENKDQPTTTSTTGTGESTSSAASASQALVAESEKAFAGAIAANLASVPDPAITYPSTPIELGALTNDSFRDRIIAFIRQVASGETQVPCEIAELPQGPARAVVLIYREGAEIGRGEWSDAKVCAALKEATRRSIAAAGGTKANLEGARFAVDLPAHDYSLVAFDGRGIELTHGLVPVRVLDKALVRERIREGKAYLLRVIDPNYKGVHKYYRAETDTFEDKLHTIYTASTIFTLLRLQKYEPDKELDEVIKGAAKFLLSMQDKDKDRGYGGFFYTFNLKTKQPQQKLVVGTTSKTIFTLVDLYTLTKDKTYLDAAKLGADWLLTMQDPDGKVMSQVRRKKSGEWETSQKESMLYTGQVLSALSRIYAVTREPKYLEGAARTAHYLTKRINDSGCYLGDDFRKPNPISSSWAILSLFDFLKVSDDKAAGSLVFRCADELLGRQIASPTDVYRYGRWEGSLSSSGNGWLAEVMSELYLYCVDKKMEKCDRYKDAVIKVTRLLMQYTYGPENSFVVKNPKMAQGGVFWNVAERYVRTDSVCHAMNAYINLVGHIGDGPLVEVPEPPLTARLGAAKKDAPEEEAESGNEEGGPRPAGEIDEETSDSEESSDDTGE